jgi:deoxycytidine triphosphate deaminase
MPILTGPEIERRSQHPERLIHPFRVSSRRGAAYDMRIARDGCVLPDGRKFRPGCDAPSDRLLLQPGQTAFVSTCEVLAVPLDLVGTISIKAKYSRLGIHLLTGLIIDPGYGENTQLRRDGRLHFGVVNLGSETVELRLGEDTMISVQFSTVAGASPAPLPTTGVDDIWERDDLIKGYGFVGELAEIGSGYRRLRDDFERQRQTTEYVIVIAVLLLLATVFSFSLAALLSFAADKDFLAAVRRVVPDDSSDRWFSLALLGIAVIGLTGIANAVRSKPAASAPSSDQAWRYQAADRRLGERRRALTYVGIGLTFLASAGAAWGLESLGVAIDALPVVLLLPALFCCGVGVTFLVAPQPDDKRFQAELKKIRKAHHTD